MENTTNNARKTCLQLPLIIKLNELAKNIIKT